jgi:Copper transport outer membrane protein, MctB
MFDLRYHVASLAAVFLALLIGILVGVGISGSVSKGEKSLEKQRIAQLQSQLSATGSTIDALKQRQQAALTFMNESYPLVMRNRLRGKRIAVAFVGRIDGKTSSLIKDTLTDAGAPQPVRVRALHVPLDTAGLDQTLTGRPALSQYSGPDQLDALGRALAEELVVGGDTPLWDTLSNQLVVERIGGLQRPVDGVVVVRSAGPQTDETGQFLRGFYGGLASANVPAVGVETTRSKLTAIRAFSENGLSSVDDLDRPEGRFALMLLLRGADRGNYGVKGSASDGLLPPVPQPLLPRG